MTLTQIQRLGTAYKAVKSVLREVERLEDPKQQEVFELGMATGALEMLLLRDNKQERLKAEAA